ncbi:hypothetical protein [Streptomyces sp. NPDC047315]|uniref:hypothetical protein n=1 Tax=Streptomyces sp. NPDC047315 TaxID=3155142 RepID=UPI0033FF6060
MDDVSQGAAATVDHVTPELARAALAAALHDTYDACTCGATRGDSTYDACTCGACTYDGERDTTGDLSAGAHCLLPPATAVPVAHPNGFVKLPLARVARDGRRLFLHIWVAGEEDAEIHDHRWDFASTVLRGALVNTTVDVAPQIEHDDAAGYRVVHYRPRPGGYRFTPVRADHDVVVTSRRTATLAAGTRYRMTARTLHRARALPGTVTLIARGAPLRDHARVLTRGALPDGPMAWREVDAAERRRHLCEAYEALGGLAP